MGDAEGTRSRFGDALKCVWASVWTARACAERALYSMDEANVAVAVLVQPAADNFEANGVALTAHPKPSRAVLGVYLNAYGGTEARVTDGSSRAEEIFVHYGRAFGKVDVEVIAQTGKPVLETEQARAVGGAC